MEFFMAVLLKKLNKDKIPKISVQADLPRLSAAEAFYYFQQQGMSAPGGTDVYSDVKDLLKNYGYRVSYIHPKEPKLPWKTDVLLWLQPRYNAAKMISLFGNYMAKGGKGIVALQFFNIQQRQYSGRNFQTVYWPQPQLQDLNRYLTHLGIRQKKEILMDKTKSNLSLDTEMFGKGRGRLFDPQQVALPFLIRAVSENFSKISPITASLSNQLFLWGNRFELDEARLKELNITWEVLIKTSPFAWTYYWKGGWVPEEAFIPKAFRAGLSPLVVYLKGVFPPIWVDERGYGKESVHLRKIRDPKKQGELLLIGSSAMFKNGTLFNSRFRHDQFLLNAVAYMAYGADMAVLQARQKIFRGFSYQTTLMKFFHRMGVIFLAPFLILLYGCRRFRLFKRPLSL